MSEELNLRVKIVDATVAGANAVKRSLTSFGSSMSGMFRGIGGFFGISLGVSGLVLALKRLIPISKEATGTQIVFDRAIKKLSASLGRDAAEISNVVNSMRQITGIDDDIIKAIASNLSYLDDIKSIGFEKSIEAVLDLTRHEKGANAALQDYISTAEQFVKIMQNPELAGRQLRLDKDVIEQIKNSGIDVQRQIIFDQLSRRNITGTAREFGSSPIGAWEEIENRWSDMLKGLGKFIDRLIFGKATPTDSAGELATRAGTRTAVGAGGAVAGAVGIAFAISALKKFKNVVFEALIEQKKPWDSLSSKGKLQIFKASLEKLFESKTLKALFNVTLQSFKSFKGFWGSLIKYIVLLFTNAFRGIALLFTTVIGQSIVAFFSAYNYTKLIKESLALNKARKEEAQSAKDLVDMERGGKQGYRLRAQRRQRQTQENAQITLQQMLKAGSIFGAETDQQKLSNFKKLMISPYQNAGAQGDELFLKVAELEDKVSGGASLKQLDNRMIELIDAIKKLGAL